MHYSRRTFLKAAGVAGAVAATGKIEQAAAQAPAPGAAPAAGRGMARKLTLLTMIRNGEYRLGARTDQGLLDVKEAAGLLAMPAPATMDALLQQEQGPALNALVDAALRSPKAKPAFVQEGTVRYGPVVTHPEKILCVGLNYRKHAQELGLPLPKVPVLFNKFNNSLNAHDGSIKLPVNAAKKFDYEVELVIVIGKQAKEVSEADALSCVAGYCTGNDFSARDLQWETGGQWMAGKTSDGFAPLGPYLVTADQIDPDNLKIECRVNGEARQSSNTNDFIFNARQQISYASRIMTLRPGDIIYTGTPEGVVQGKQRGPNGEVLPKEHLAWLKAGDKVACSLEKLGELRFTLT
jgi:2-keto-4-pentenoate hydratase/2-oxohepta-3-ene-1,7-dioic acid hydratase in catechol pathway